MRRPMRSGMLATIALAALATACAPAAVPPPVLEPVPHPAAATPGVPRAGVLPELPNDAHWVRNSAEYRALTKQIYRSADAALRALVAQHAGGEWGVVLDADETVLDNSDYQKWLAETGLSFTEDTWNEYVQLRISRETPGGAAFTRTIRELGGRIVIVTNRDEIVCDDTRANLTALGIAWDAVLCKAPGISDKNPRFEAVARGTTGKPLPPLTVLMYVGDNIQDFPRLTQALRDAPADAFAEFGRRYIVLPNPMYGSFERRERR
jgi:5'-nucleotidase (lipoprotein e(P4) family)